MALTTIKHTSKPYQEATYVEMLSVLRSLVDMVDSNMTSIAAKEDFGADHDPGVQ